MSLAMNGVCLVCGGKMVEIRGRRSIDQRRVVCPTCISDRLEQINEISARTYGHSHE